MSTFGINPNAAGFANPLNISNAESDQVGVTSAAPSVYNPYENPRHEGGWGEARTQALKDLQYDPSTFRTVQTQDGRYHIMSGDDVVADLPNENWVSDFTSLYTQGWQQRQDSRYPDQGWQDILKQYGWTPPDITSPEVQTSMMTASEDQLVPEGSGQLTGQHPDLQHSEVGTSKAELPEALQTALVEAIESSKDMDELLKNLGPVVGTLSQGSQIEAAQAEMARESTVQGQMEDLMKSFEDGNPPWATGPMRAANAIMAQRGLSASSMAGQAITTAVMEASLPIAMADAETSAQFQFANLSNLQQARVQNAQSFLQMDLANFSAAQQMQMFKAQERANSLLSDVAMQNAAAQFNATNENQTRQFEANMISQVSQFNASQANAMEQFNSGQANALAQFREQMRNDREKFNANNRLIIDQANAKWRQEVTTINNATINEANRINAANLLSTTLAEYNNISQSRRDALNYAFTSSEQAKDRALELVLAELQEEGATDRQASAARQSSRESLFRAAGNLVAQIFR